MANIPGYVRLYETGVLENRVNEAIASLGSCRVCPWNCEINRLSDEWKVCSSASRPARWRPLGNWPKSFRAGWNRYP